jgi:hypothetical protein
MHRRFPFFDRLGMDGREESIAAMHRRTPRTDKCRLILNPKNPQRYRFTLSEIAKAHGARRPTRSFNRDPEGSASQRPPRAPLPGRG